MLAAFTHLVASMPWVPDYHYGCFASNRHWRLCHFADYPYYKDDLQNEYCRHSVLELLVHRLVVTHFHAAPCSDASAYGCKQEQCCFRDTPLGMLCLVLVNAIDDERQDIDDNEVYEYCCHALLFANLLFYPRHQHADGIVLFFFREFPSCWDVVPFGEASTTTATCGVLG